MATRKPVFSMRMTHAMERAIYRQAKRAGLVTKIRVDYPDPEVRAMVARAVRASGRV